MSGCSLPLRLAAALAAFAGTATAYAAGAPPEVPSLPEQRTALWVTVYNDGQALVKDTRRLDLKAGMNRIAFREVAAKIQPETASLKAAGGGQPFELIEQNFDFDLLTPETLLNKYVGRDVTVIRTNPSTGAESRENARVLSNNQGVVLKYSDRIETGTPGGRIAFGDVPADLRERPTLSVLLNAASGGAREAELMYLTAGLGWRADYIATLDAAGGHMALAGWVTLTNQSGTSFDDAQLQLVAGSLNRVRQPTPYAPSTLALSAAAAPRMAEEKLFEYHLYTLGRLTRIAENQTKQVALLSAAGVPIEREYVLEGAGSYYQSRLNDQVRNLKPSVYISFDNKGGELGRPLPAGTVRVYTEDSRGGAQLVGEDSIGHTAAGEHVRLRMGEAFDLTADRTQTDYRSLSDRSAQSSYRVEIRNADHAAAAVQVRERMPGDWSVPAESLPHVKESAHTASWLVRVPGEGKTVLEYTVITRW